MKNRKHLGTKTAVSLLLILSLAVLIASVMLMSFLLPSSTQLPDGPSGLEKQTLPTGQPPLTDPEAKWDNIPLDDEDDLFYGLRSEALRLLSKMSLEEKIGQLFLIYFDAEKAEQQITTVFPAGFIMTGDAFVDSTPEKTLSLTTSLQSLSNIPMFFGVNEEGGDAVSISDKASFSSSAFMSPSDVYSGFGINGVKLDTLTKSTFLKDLGINLNFAPVCDVCIDPEAYIYDRTLGLDAERTGAYVEAVVSTMNSSNLSGVLKHFPGYGSAASYENGERVTISTSLQKLRENDFLPFIAGIEAKCPAVLLSHILYTAIDEALPASLSENTVKLLRDELDFGGVIICDSVSKATLSNYSLSENAAVLAIKAGVNVIISDGTFEEDYAAVKSAVEKSEISEDMIDLSVFKILQWKLYSSLIN